MPVWQLLVLLVVASVFMMMRSSKTGILITYAFTVHLAFSFLKDYFSTVVLLFIGIFAVIILLIGLHEALTES